VTVAARIARCWTKRLCCPVWLVKAAKSSAKFFVVVPIQPRHRGENIVAGIKPELKSQFPTLEHRANRYVPILIGLLSLIVCILAMLTVLQASARSHGSAPTSGCTLPGTLYRSASSLSLRPRCGSSPPAPSSGTSAR
jgi:hypothetical protein